MPNHILTLDNSAFNLLYCERRFQLTCIQGLRGADSQTAAFGNAFHTAIEVLDKSGDVNSAMEAVLSKGAACDELKLIEVLTTMKLTNRTPPALVLADGSPAIEVKFHFLYKTLSTVHGPLDIYLDGTIDRIHITDDDILVWRDYKTASDFKEASQRTKIEEYENSFQLPFYVWASIESGLLPLTAQALFEAGKYRTEYVFAFYNGVPVRIKKQEFSPYGTSFWYRFENTLARHIRRAVEVWSLNQNEETAPYSGMNTYKGCVYCPYRPACIMFDSAKETAFLERFDRTPYDPASFR